MDTTTKLLEERGKTHGNFSTQAFISQTLKEHVRSFKGFSGWHGLTCEQKEALDMILHKIARIIAGNHSFKDHWDDIAGYARLVADRCPPPKPED